VYRVVEHGGEDGAHVLARPDRRQRLLHLLIGVGVYYFTEMCSGSEAGSYLRLIDSLSRSLSGANVLARPDRRQRFLHLEKGIQTPMARGRST